MYLVPDHLRPKVSDLLSIDLIVVLSHLRPYVLDTLVKRRAELSTD